MTAPNLPSSVAAVVVPDDLSQTLLLFFPGDRGKVARHDQTDEKVSDFIRRTFTN